MHKLIPVGAALLAAALGVLPFFQNIELDTYDRRVAATARPAEPSHRITLVFIDNDSVRRMEPLVGRWPWPRLVHGMAIDFLAAAGARLIVYDIVFAERDRRKFMVGDTEWTGEESDAALVEATRKAGNVVHAAEAAGAELIDPSRDVGVDMRAPALNVTLPPTGCVEPRPRISPPFSELARASRAIGHTLFILDSDGPLRRIPPIVQVGDRTIPSLSLAAANAAGASQPPPVSRDQGQCAALVPWRGPAQNPDGQPTFRYVSFYDVLYAQQQILEGQKPSIDLTLFKDRIVIVGGNAEGLHEAFTTPFPEGEINGPEVHASMLDALLDSRSMVRAPASMTAVLTIAAAAVVGAAGLFLNAWLTGVVALLAAAALVWLALMAFDVGSGLWISITTPALAIIFTFVGDLGWKYFVEGRDKRLIKKMFSRYVSKDVFDQLVANPSLAALGGARRNMTVLFSDIRGFTTMSEKGTPEDVVRQLNELFTRMVAVVFEHRGTVDKFVGDMVMALYGAPLDDEDHADHAVQTALAMISTLRAMNAEWDSQGRPTLDIGIGVNTGDMVAGNIGSDTIMSYTVIGDAVNLGARLESLNKDYGTRIIISEFTRGALKGRYDIHPLGDVVVKGKTKPVAIFEVKPT
jgi:adenylate cyclase